MIDIKYTEDGDIDLSTGDIQWCDTSEATAQHKRDILLSSQGDNKESPLSGVGVVDYLNDDDEGETLFLRNIAKQMQFDGINVEQVAVSDAGEIVIDGGYE